MRSLERMKKGAPIGIGKFDRDEIYEERAARYDPDRNRLAAVLADVASALGILLGYDPKAHAVACGRSRPDHGLARCISLRRGLGEGRASCARSLGCGSGLLLGRAARRDSR